MSVYSMPLRAAVLATTLSLSVLFAAPAQAFSDDEARRAILELREQIKQLTEQNRQARLQLADQLETIQHEMASMRGQMEQLNMKSELERRANQDRSGSTTDTKVADPQEQAAYEAAMGLFRSGKYKEAASSLATFIQTYPKHGSTAAAACTLVKISRDPYKGCRASSRQAPTIHARLTPCSS
jgi:TolA-binding protein